jgi:AmiR/NasT family two-component response regulator
LNLFSFRPNVWDTDAETIGTVLAAHAAAAILAGRHDQQMQAALASRDRIGQAKGVIMERFGVDEIRAFEMLRVLSQESNSKLVDIAQQVLDTRDQSN